MGRPRQAYDDLGITHDASTIAHSASTVAYHTIQQFLATSRTEPQHLFPSRPEKLIPPMSVSLR